MNLHEQMLDLVDLYALDALEGAELSEFESHLGACELCQQSLAHALTLTAALVGDTDPPNHIWDRIVEEIDPLPAEVVQLPRRRRALLGVASVAAAAVVGLFAVLASQESDPSLALAVAAEQAAEEPGSTVADFNVGDVTVAQVVLTKEGAGYVIPTAALPALDESHTYQLWVINQEGGVISGGVLGNSPGISTFTWTDGVSGFALTREVAGGVAVSEGDVVAVITDA